MRFIYQGIPEKGIVLRDGYHFEISAASTEYDNSSLEIKEIIDSLIIKEVPLPEIVKQKEKEIMERKMQLERDKQGKSY